MAAEPRGAEYDLLIVDEDGVGSAEAPVRMFVGVIPPDLQELIKVEEDVSYVVDWNRTAPMLRHVQLADVQIGEQPKLAVGAATKDLEERGYEILIDGNAGPLMLQRREGLSVSYWFTFHTDRSTLPYRVGFPILAANAIESALKQASLSDVAAAPTGVLAANFCGWQSIVHDQNSGWRIIVSGIQCRGNTRRDSGIPCRTLRRAGRK